MFKYLLLCSFFLLPILSCNQSESYLYTYQSNLRIIERQDHQACVSKGLDYGQWDEITTEMYWRCRYNLLMNRKISHAITAKSIRHNAIIDKIAEEILKNLSRAKYSALAKIEDNIELSDHQKCQSNSQSIGQSISNKLGISNDDDYYQCRQNLVLSRIPPAPKVTNAFEAAIFDDKKSKEYLKIAARSRNSNQDAMLAVKMLAKYPNCQGLNVNSDDFKKCSMASDDAKKCLGNIRSIRVKKQLEDKLYCQKQAFIQFPDNYAIAKDKSASEITKLKLASKANDEELKMEANNTLSYLENGKNADNIGKYVQDIGSKEEESKEMLYSKVELLKLRERFIYQCNKKMEEKLPDFIKIMREDCLNIARNWDMEEI